MKAKLGRKNGRYRKKNISWISTGLNLTYRFLLLVFNKFVQFFYLKLGKMKRETAVSLLVKTAVSQKIC